MPKHSGFRAGYRLTGDPKKDKGEHHPGLPEITSEVGFSPTEVVTPQMGTDQPVPFSSEQIPYRGAEQHGVAYVGTPSEYGIDPGRNILTDVVVEPVTMPEPEPVAVRIVSTDVPVVERRKFTPTNFVWPQASAGASYALQVCGYRQNRTKLHLMNIPNPASGTGDKLFVNDSLDFNITDCYILRVGDSLDIDTTEPVYVMLDPAAGNGGAQLLVLQTYTQRIAHE